MSFGDHAILWLHVTAAVFTIGPGTAAIMSTPRYIRKQNPVVVGYLLRTTRIYSFATLLVLIFGLVLTGMTHKFSQWWISASLTLFVVAFVLLVIILRDQRKALTALTPPRGRRWRTRWKSATAGGPRARQPRGRRRATSSPRGSGGRPAATAMLDQRAAVERGRIASLGGLTALIWLVILIFMVWH